MNPPASLLSAPLEASAPSGEWEKPASAADLPEPQWEIIHFCVRATRALGLPRSAGEIFGFVFSSARPVNFEEIVSALGISKGSASQGLRYLRRAGALGVTYIARDRRDHFVAETALGRIFAGHFMENATHYLGDQSERLQHLRSQLLAAPSEQCAHLPERLAVLAQWLQQTGRALQSAGQSLAETTTTGGPTA